MSIENEIQFLLRQHGAVLERCDKHLVYRFPNGSIFVMGKTPSDRSAAQNALCKLRRMLGIKRDIRKNPNRREKCPPPKAAAKIEPTDPKLDFNNQLWMAVFDGKLDAGIRRIKRDED